ncbi:metallophosphoesterase [Breoghania sp. L-A4]|uniref:metallophosphoesterase n=1 Tax=Breoghania sp. L-A4 TaxID=2304600 RepID=UPI000E35CC2B|nr:metallophosphoesterase [Breoghania sp. L-A4]AXS39516.1 metallophosphoesterase [Breoghania sp. L-A4]
MELDLVMMRGAIAFAVLLTSLALPADSRAQSVPAASIPPLPTTPGPSTPLLAAWTQFVNDRALGTKAENVIQARFVVLGDLADCSGYVVKDALSGAPGLPTALRGHMHGVDPATGNPITVSVCTASLPAYLSSVSINSTTAGRMTVYPSGQGAVLPGPAAMSQKPALTGVVLADTGCRGKYTGGGARAYQDCQTDWGLPRVIGDAVKQNPAFVLHGGDYHYFFEDASAFWDADDGRDRFEYWLQEFLIPAHPLLMRAPWVLGRGNHERCIEQRWFGEGWHVLFANTTLTNDRDEPVRPCYDPDPNHAEWVTPTWAVDLGVPGGAAPWRVVVIDSDQPYLSAYGFTQAGALTSAHGRDALWLSHYPPSRWSTTSEIPISATTASRRPRPAPWIAMLPLRAARNSFSPATSISTSTFPGTIRRPPPRCLR